MPTKPSRCATQWDCKLIDRRAHRPVRTPFDFSRLIREIDAGYTYFWTRRGVSNPVKPSYYST